MEKIVLCDFKDFINIENKFFGGYQNWLYTEEFRSKFWANRSCGVVAAANTAYYLSVTKNIPLYDKGVLNLENFTCFIDEVYKFVKPYVCGIPTLYSMRRGFTKFTKSKGVTNLVCACHSDFKDKKKTVDFIKSALERNYPIMMLNWNSDIKRLRYHWVTVIGYFRDEFEEYISVSNWGQIENIDINSLLADSSFYIGLIYFKLEDKEKFL